MDINTMIQNENGVTALMAASKDSDLIFVVKYLLNHDSDNINLYDKNKETALFYAIYNIDALRLLLDSNIDANYLNNNQDSFLTYCCRNKIYGPLKTLFVKDIVDVNVYDKNEKTALMYLMEDCRIAELKYLVDKETINFYYENSRKETAMSIFFKNYYECYKQLNMEKILKYVEVIKVLVEKNVNLNISIDEEGNTPMMFFFMIEDWISMTYLILNYTNLDLSFKNKKGESFSSLCEKHKPTKESTYSGINTKYLMYYIFTQPTFDASYRGISGINVLMNYIIHYFDNNDANYNKILSSHKEFSTVTNDDQENLLIVATKLGRQDVIYNIISAEGCNVNQQDILGNTALHYAIMLNDYYMANLLAYNKADINIKNKEGQSPVNMVNNSGDSTMLKFLLKPCPAYKFKEKEKKGNSLFNLGKSYNFRELNVDLRKKYQEKYNSMIDSVKVDHKYIPNVTPKYNTEYYTDVFKVYFNDAAEAFDNEYSRYGHSPLYGSRVKISPELYNMLINKNTLKLNAFMHNNYLYHS
ncbi:hypothetical protein PIROE2DRAFT_64375 [Piromyces sp. E2]|nr:hypothetical protein PIROE2DRAFT_64375 [Piromyces sp. E2]|eukprot:OUM58501.1 hypothetical protein PIROE2DRAFT_64375 [Piromyces sp. E2]